MSYLRTVFSLDLRSLALMRMLLASLILVQILTIFPDAEFFLSDSGAMPRKLLIDRHLNEWVLSLYMMARTPFQAQLLLFVHAVAAIGLLLGFRTKWCAAINWILIISLHGRNTWMMNGGDTFILLMSFWILFLPVHARASLDRLFSDKEPESNHTFFDFASAVLILQVCLVYWSTAVFKSDTTWWTGEAVRIALESDEFAKPAALFLRGLPYLHGPLTWATILWEIAGPALLFIPFANAWMRLVAISGFILFHLGLEATMELGLFPAICITAWIAFLPTAFWNHLSKRFPGSLYDSVKRVFLKLNLSPGSTPGKPGLVARTLVVVAFLYVIVWNMRTHDVALAKTILADGRYAPGYMFRLRQKWNMFSPGPPRTDGWFVLRARQFNGNEIDIMRDGAPLTWDKPDLISGHYRNHHWRKYFSYVHRKNQNMRGPAADYFINKWNQSVDVGYQVREAELYFVLERTLDDGVAEPEEIRLWYRNNIKQTLR